MQIHVVQPGNTLMEIAMMYNVPLNELVTSNKIENPETLVIGQTIVIPIWGSYYFVQPGDSLYTISYKFQVPIQQLERINNLTSNSQIVPGMRLYIPQKPRTPIYSAAYVDTDITGERSGEVVLEVGEFLSSIQVFSYQVNSKGEFKPISNEEEVLSAAKETNTRPLMVITNIEDGRFSTEAATAVLGNPQLREEVLDKAIAIMKEKGYKGLDIDYEYLGAQNREAYNSFLVEAREKLSRNGFSLSTALAPKLTTDQVGVLYEGHDYEFHGNIVDYVFIMTYEWGYVAGPPRAVAPINEVKKVMDFTITQIPKDKIMMGIPLYGYDWKLPFVQGESRARAISSQEAILIADRFGANIQFDEEAASPFFVYRDEEGINHEVWFEDARSIQAKFDLVKSLGIRGFFYWVLGREFPQNWLLVEDNFVIKTY
ncbi:MAG: spore gernimation protein [Firmicutes bacterium HGW-Firmicutes-7]|nr:MAG: spore gernimation protein [Firmicutes bacterium HGW-Firmicutes-7]